MRHRRRDWQSDLLSQEFDFFIKEPYQYKGQWKQHFGFEKVHLEIGSGKGQYLVEMAKLYPNELFIGIEKMPLIGAYILRLLKEASISNAKIIIDKAENLLDSFDDHEIDILHLNFSDPWPKKAHTHRRLTSDSFLMEYKRILATDGQLQIKTDNQSFFEFSTIQLNNISSQLLEFSVDYRRQDHPEDVTTEYEERFINLKQPIYRSVWTFRHDFIIDKATNK